MLLGESEKKRVEKFGLKHNIQKFEIMTSDPITSWQRRGKSGNSDGFYFLGFQINAHGDSSHETKRKKKKKGKERERNACFLEEKP